MYDTDTKDRFIELRAKGWSLTRIAAELGVAPRTLGDWSHQAREEIRFLRAAELEALHEKILASHEQELTRLKSELDRLEQELAKRSPEFISTENIYRLAALIRAEIRKACQVPQPVDNAMAQEE